MRNFAILGCTFRCNKLAVNIYVHVLKRHSPSGCGFEGSRGIAAKLAEVSMGEEIKVESIWLDYAKGSLSLLQPLDVVDDARAQLAFGHGLGGSMSASVSGDFSACASVSGGERPLAHSVFARK